MIRLTRHTDVRQAAKDWKAFSSDLQGDPDVRAYRQLPLEADPPAHRRYRDLLEPLLGRRAVGAMAPAIEEICQREVHVFVVAGGGDVVHELAFPVVLQSLAVLFRRTTDITEWRRWGIETWITRPDGTRDGAHLDRYVARVMAEARARPDPEGDVFQRLAAAQIDGRSLDDDEFRGIVGLILAGGRDTVIKLIAGAVWHLARVPTDLRWLQSDPTRLEGAIDEWLRWLSPLPRMMRVVRHPSDLLSAQVGDSVQLDFLAANHDEKTYPEPARIDVARDARGHLAFGSGPHTCIGAHLARVQAHAVLRCFVRSVTSMELVEPCDLVCEQVGAAEVPVVIRRVPVRVVPFASTGEETSRCLEKRPRGD